MVIKDVQAVDFTDSPQNNRRMNLTQVETRQTVYLFSPKVSVFKLLIRTNTPGFNRSTISVLKTNPRIMKVKFNRMNHVLTGKRIHCVSQT